MAKTTKKITIKPTNRALTKSKKKSMIFAGAKMLIGKA